MRIIDWSSDVCSSDLVFAIAGKTLAEDVNVETGINDAIERIGQFGINCAFPGREIEASVGRQAQSVILTDLGEEGGIPAITLDIGVVRSEEHTSELQSLMRISYAVFCLKKKNKQSINTKIQSDTY